MPNDYFWSTFPNQNYVCIVRLPYYLWNTSVIQPADSTPLHVTNIKKLQNNVNCNDKDNNDDDDDDELFGIKHEDSASVIKKSNDGHYLELVTSLLILITSFLRVPEIYSPLHVYLNGNFLRDFLMKSLYTLCISPIWMHVLPIITSKISLLLIILSYTYK